MSTTEYEQVIQTLSVYLVDVYNAPNQEAAQQAAQQEIDDMVTMCDHPSGTLLSIERSIADQDITEKTSVLAPTGSSSHAKIWDIVEDDCLPLILTKTSSMCQRSKTVGRRLGIRRA